MSRAIERTTGMEEPAARHTTEPAADDLLGRIDRARLPRHIAVIMDGNGRWAHQRGWPRLAGHRRGTESVREITRACGELGVGALTLYAFSTENWLRPKTEVNGLMRLLVKTLQREVPALDRNAVRLRVSGRISRMPAPVRKALDEACAALARNTGLVLNLALNYGGRQEIVDAVNSLLADGETRVTEEALNRRMYTAGLPDPDLLIRTSGEMRLSNFLLWQSAYAELYVTPTLWPDFRRRNLYEAIVNFQSRSRRFGGV